MRIPTEPNPNSHKTWTEPNPNNEGPFPSLVITSRQRVYNRPVRCDDVDDDNDDAMEIRDDVTQCDAHDSLTSPVGGYLLEVGVVVGGWRNGGGVGLVVEPRLFICRTITHR